MIYQIKPTISNMKIYFCLSKRFAKPLKPEYRFVCANDTVFLILITPEHCAVIRKSRFIYYAVQKRD